MSNVTAALESVSVSGGNITVSIRYSAGRAARTGTYVLTPAETRAVLSYTQFTKPLSPIWQNVYTGLKEAVFAVLTASGKLGNTGITATVTHAISSFSYQNDVLTTVITTSCTDDRGNVWPQVTETNTQKEFDTLSLAATPEDTIAGYITAIYGAGIIGL
jgi:hypothetical protein